MSDFDKKILAALCVSTLLLFTKPMSAINLLFTGIKVIWLSIVTISLLFALAPVAILSAFGKGINGSKVSSLKHAATLGIRLRYLIKAVWDFDDTDYEVQEITSKWKHDPSLTPNTNPDTVVHGPIPKDQPWDKEIYNTPPTALTPAQSNPNRRIGF